MNQQEEGGGTVAEGYREYTLMHKDIPVLTLTLDQATGSISAIGGMINAEHLPLGIAVHKGVVDRAALNDWWIGRSIPASRAGLQSALDAFNISAPQKLLEKCLGLSLSDPYWISPAGESLLWRDVNFFDNLFSEDVGEILFGGNAAGREISLMSPDNTSDGWLRKKWVVRNGKRYLVKGGSGAIRQEPYNEVIASRIMEPLGIPHVSYTLEMHNGIPCSVCEDFISPDTEYVSAWYVMHTMQKPNHVSLYNHYIQCTESLDIKDMETYLAQQITLDYLITNEDRHQGNFGVIRNANTLELLGAAPIFDSGSSLWFTLPTPQIRANARVACKPFKGEHSEQLRLVHDFDWLDTSALSHIGDIAMEVFAGSDFVDGARAGAIARALDERAVLLKEHIRAHVPAVDDAAKDIQHNVAYSGNERCGARDQER